MVSLNIKARNFHLQDIKNPLYRTTETCCRITSSSKGSVVKLLVIRPDFKISKSPWKVYSELWRAQALV
jgi:hypothetical protein